MQHTSFIITHKSANGSNQTNQTSARPQTIRIFHFWMTLIALCHPRGLHNIAVMVTIRILTLSLPSTTLSQQKCKRMTFATHSSGEQHLFSDHIHHKRTNSWSNTAATNTCPCRIWHVFIKLILQGVRLTNLMFKSHIVCTMWWCCNADMPFIVKWVGAHLRACAFV